MLFLLFVLLVAFPLPPLALSSRLGTDLDAGLARIPGGRPRGRPLVLPLVLLIPLVALLLAPVPIPVLALLPAAEFEFDAAERGRASVAASTLLLETAEVVDTEAKGGRRCNRPFDERTSIALMLLFLATRGDGDGLPSNGLATIVLRP